MKKKVLVFIFSFLFLAGLSFGEGLSIFFSTGTIQNFSVQEFKYERSWMIGYGSVNDSEVVTFDQRFSFPVILGLEKSISEDFGFRVSAGYASYRLNGVSSYTLSYSIFNYPFSNTNNYESESSVSGIMFNLNLYKDIRFTRTLGISASAGVTIMNVKNDLSAYVGYSESATGTISIPLIGNYTGVLPDYYNLEIYNDETFTKFGGNVSLDLFYMVSYNLKVFFGFNYVFVPEIETQWKTRTKTYQGMLYGSSLTVDSEDFLKKVANTTLKYSPSFFIISVGLKYYL